MGIGEKIREVRKKENLSQGEFGEKLFYNKSTISKWESNQATPNITVLKQISSKFNIGIDYFFDGKDIGKKKKASKNKLADEKLTIKWEKVNYSGNKVLLNKSKSVSVLKIFSILLIPLGIFMSGISFIFFSSSTIAFISLFLTGIFLWIASAIIIPIYWLLSSKQALRNRYNVIFYGYETYFELENKISNNKKKFLNEIQDIHKLDYKNTSELEITILLKNEDKVVIFDADESFFQYLKKVKGGLSS